MKDKIFIHYGTADFIKEIFLPIENTPCSNKPGKTGLWASPIDSEYGWKDWCEEENFRECQERLSFQFRLSDSARVYVIDGVSDLVNIPHKMGSNGCLLGSYIDFEEMATKYDAIFLTVEGQWATRLSTEINLYGWDCESILVMNPDVIELVEAKCKA